MPNSRWNGRAASSVLRRAACTPARRSRSTKPGRQTGLNIALDLQKLRITVNEQPRDA